MRGMEGRMCVEVCGWEGWRRSRNERDGGWDVCGGVWGGGGGGMRGGMWRCVTVEVGGG